MTDFDGHAIEAAIDEFTESRATDTEQLEMRVAKVLALGRFGPKEKLDNRWDGMTPGAREGTLDVARAALASTPLERYKTALEEIAATKGVRDRSGAAGEKWAIATKALDKEKA